MALPRDLIPASTYVLTRHCTHQQPLLSMTPTVRQIFLYILGTALRACNVRLHAFVVLPKGWRAVFTDMETNVPHFAHNVHRRSAFVLNLLFGRSENMWSTRRYHLQRLETYDDVLEAMVQTMTLPVELGCTDDLESWDGLVTRPEDFIGRGMRPRRPVCMGRGQGAPLRAHLRHCVPRGVRRKSKSSWIVKLREMVAIRVVELTQARPPQPPPPAAAPSYSTPFPTPQDTPSNFVRSACPDTRAKKLLEHLRFHTHYQQALATWRLPDRDAIFPYGTFWMRVFHKASSRGAPTSMPDSET